MDDCVVVRGGLMGVLALRQSLEACRARLGFKGLSFWGENGMTVKEICLQARLRNSRIRVSSVGRLRALGLEPYRSGPRPHLSVRFEGSPTDEELWRLARAFHPDIPNPRPRG